MARQGVTREQVIIASVDLIEKYGAAAFSMRTLAESLNIKAASLYNHIESMDALLKDVCIYALKAWKNAESEAIDGKSGASAITALACASRQFAKEHRELYRLIMKTTVSLNDRLNDISPYITEPYIKVLESFSLSTDEKNHWQRVLRGIIHGFVSQEDFGFFAHLPVDVNESFDIAIQCYIDGLNQLERRKNT